MPARLPPWMRGAADRRVGGKGRAHLRQGPIIRRIGRRDSEASPMSVDIKG
jgi:hypothetical protein